MKTGRINLLVLLALMVILAVLRILGFDGLYGQDSYAYADYAQQLKEAMLNGQQTGAFFWPYLYPLLGALISLTGLSVSLSLQIVSVFALWGVYMFTRKLLLLLFDKEKVNLYLILFLLMSPFVLRSSFLVMSDSTAVFFLTAAVYYAFRFHTDKRIKSLILLVCMIICGLFARYASIIPLLVISVWITYDAFSNFRLRYLWVLLVPLPFFILYFMLGEPGHQQMFQHDWVSTWDMKNFILSNFTTADGFQNNLLPNLFYAFLQLVHPGFLFPGIIMIIFILIKWKALMPKSELFILFFIFIMYGFFLAGIPYQNLRFLQLTFPIVLILFFPVWSFSKAGLVKLKFLSISILVCIVFIQIVLFARAFYPMYERNKLEQHISESMSKYEGNVIYAFDIDIALQGRNIDLEYNNLWVKEYDSFEADALVLFNEEKFDEQWEGMAPMLNWQNLKSDYSLSIEEEWQDGWTLYRIEQ